MNLTDCLVLDESVEIETTYGFKCITKLSNDAKIMPVSHDNNPLHESMPIIFIINF